MVKNINFKLFNLNFFNILAYTNSGSNNNSISRILGKNISYNNSPKKGHNHPYSAYARKFIIKDPFNNRKEISNIAKGEKGVYLFEIKSRDLKYVGSSINLYNRVCSYFMPSILAKSDRRVLRFFNKYGFKDVDLTLFILDSNCSWDKIIELEQYLIDTLTPELNVDLIAGGFFYTGYHKPMSEKAKNMLIQLRGIPIYIYDTNTKSLIFISDSSAYARQWLYDNLKIHHVSLDNCLSNGNLYLNKLFFSLDIVSEFPFESILNSNELKSLIEKTRLEYKPIQPASKNILAENILHPELTKSYRSIGELSRQLKGDRGTIRSYLNENSAGLYRGQWKFSLIEKN